jgi:hypothetical protein
MQYEMASGSGSEADVVCGLQVEDLLRRRGEPKIGS